VSATSTERQTPTTENCRFCWMCRHVCPVGHVTSRETLTPHAWALTIESVRRGQLAWNDETAAVMYACADCGLCQTHCVTDQPLPDAIAAARADIVRLGHAPAAILEFQRRLEASIGESPADFAKGSRALFVGGKAGPSGAGEVVAARHLLEAAGIPAVLAGDGRLTGLTASSLGLIDVARRLARDLVAVVVASGVTEVFVLRPADKWAFEYVYPKRLGVEWPSNVAVTEVTVALAGVVEKGGLKLSRRDAQPPAYHDPCHSPRIARDATAPRRLLAAIYGDQPAPELFWRAHRAHPCGAVGGLDVTHPEIARQLTAARIEGALSTGATMLVTDDPVCLGELRRYAQDRLDVVGLFTLLARTS
jgi:Fe-S oxidoreductase